MPNYKEITKDPDFGRRAAERTLALRRRLDKEIPARTIDGTLLLATWRCSAGGGTTW